MTRRLLHWAVTAASLLAAGCERAPPAPGDAGATQTPPSSATGAASAASPAAAGSVAAPAEIATAVGAVLDDWHDAASRADEERYFSHFTTDGVFLGTDASERWDVPAFRAYSHPHFAKGKAWRFRATRRAVMSGAGNTLAWFDEDLTTESLGPARGSGVLRREADGRWRIALYNLTITVPNERFDEVKKLLAAAADAGLPQDAGGSAAGPGGDASGAVRDAGGKPIATPGSPAPPGASVLDTRD
ncbi:MAG: nuclear transport factor 2 family protein [Polyangiaceae bacterium]